MCKIILLSGRGQTDFVYCRYTINVELSNKESSKVQEPTNLELKEMLVDIKIELSNIVRENNKFAKEIAELRNLIKEQTTELDSFKTSR